MSDLSAAERRVRPASNRPEPVGPPEPTVDVDVVVVGAGPAGSAAATFLAQAGRSVILMEKAAFPRDKVCGDALTPRAVKALQMLGLHDEAAGTPAGCRQLWQGKACG